MWTLFRLQWKKLMMWAIVYSFTILSIKHYYLVNLALILYCSHTSNWFLYCTYLIHLIVWFYTSFYLYHEFFLLEVWWLLVLISIYINSSLSIICDITYTKNLAVIPSYLYKNRSCILFIVSNYSSPLFY